MEKQKELALSRIRDELIRLNNEQALAKQAFHKSVKIIDETGRAGLAKERSRSTEQSRSHAPGASQKRKKQRRVC